MAATLRTTGSSKVPSSVTTETAMPLSSLLYSPATGAMGSSIILDCALCKPELLYINKNNPIDSRKIASRARIKDDGEKQNALLPGGEGGKLIQRDSEGGADLKLHGVALIPHPDLLEQGEDHFLIKGEFFLPGGWPKSVVEEGQ